MFCPNCGSPIENNSKFCPACGTTVDDGQPANMNNQYGYSQPAAPYGQQPFVPPVKPTVARSSNPVINTVKGLFASPLFLIVAISFSASLFLQLVSMLGGSGSWLYQIYGYLRLFGMGDAIEIFDFASGITTSTSTSVLLSLVYMTPSILITVGLWLTYASAANRRTPYLKTTGISMIKVVYIINLVLYAIPFVIVQIVFFSYFANSGSSSYYYSAVNTAIIILQMLFIPVVVLTIMYFVKVLSSANTVKYTIITAQPSCNVSGFVAVLIFIAVSFKFIAFLIGIVGGSYYRFNAIDFLQNVSEMTSMVTAALLIFRYRAAMKEHMPGGYSSSQPIPPAPSYDAGVPFDGPIE